MARSERVAIIGAGVSGLAAAQTLNEAGCEVIIVEARDRAGGRLRTLMDFAAGPVELGAEFVHGKPRRLRKLLKKAGAHLSTRAFAPLILQEGAEHNVSGSWERVFGALSEAPETDRSFESRIREKVKSGEWNEEDARFARQYVEGYMAADVDSVSAKALAMEEQAAEEISGDTSFRVQEGYRHLTDYLVQQLPREAQMLGTEVKEVHWKRGRVRIVATGPGGYSRPEILADRVLITLPISLLNSVAFSPGVPEKLAAASALRMGGVVKTLLRLRAPLSELPELSRKLRKRLRKADFMIIPGAPIPTWWTAVEGDAPVLVGWTGGPLARRLSGHPETHVIRTAVSTLATAIGAKEDSIAATVDATHVADWLQDPWARGAYSWVPVGSGGAAEALASPLGKTLFFAGEATDTQGYRGTVHGAIETGLRAATEILQLQ